jgi:meso-butanediol dehydrogenase/(S,S)-butanediol dehydrogenase/diacetyl reductase
MTTTDVDRIYALNIRGVHLCYKFAAKQMIKQGTGGKLIAACSLAGYRASSLLSSYVASKVSPWSCRCQETLNLVGISSLCVDTINQQRWSSLNMASLVTATLLDSVSLPFGGLMMPSDFSLTRTSLRHLLIHTICAVTTEMTDYRKDDPNSVKAKAIIDAALKQTPLKRIGHPDDVANLVSFLVSRNSDCKPPVVTLVSGHDCCAPVK